MALANEIAAAGLKPGILNPGFDLTLRPMKYELFYKMYIDAITNTWTVDEVDFFGRHCRP